MSSTTDDQTIAIAVERATKTFRLPHEKSSSIKSGIVHVFKKKDKSIEVQHALKGISFNVKKGEFFGIVGRNGSGKSTLLKMLAGIYTPTSGKIETHGKIVPFIELGVGFNPELTGRDNVYLNGALLGFSRDQIDAMYDEIVSFAELGRFMDQKLKNYSSGMQVRLAFSIAIKADGDILILDEVLAVGDEAFQRKCFEYFAQLKRDKKTVILVTHSMDSVQSFCTRAMYIEKGKVKVIGNTGEVTRAYEEANRPKDSSVQIVRDNKRDVHGVKLSLTLKNQDGKSLEVFSPSDTLVFEASLLSKQTIEDAIVSIEVQQSDSRKVYRVATDEHPGQELGTLHKGVRKQLRIEVDNIFPENSYEVNIFVRSKDRTTDYIWEPGILQFSVITSAHRGKWSFRPRYELQVVDEGVNKQRGV